MSDQNLKSLLTCAPRSISAAQDTAERRLSTCGQQSHLRAQDAPSHARRGWAFRAFRRELRRTQRKARIPSIDATCADSERACSCVGGILRGARRIVAILEFDSPMLPRKNAVKLYRTSALSHLLGITNNGIPMPTTAQVSELLKAIASILWPFIALAAVWKFLPVLRSVVESAKSRKFTIKIAGQELTMEEANQQNLSLIEDLQAKVIELAKKVEVPQGADAAGAQATALPKLDVFTFSGDDLSLQKSRLHLAESISRIVDQGLNEFSVAHIQQLVIAQHNDSYRFHISPNRVADHLHEAEILYEYLSKKLIESPTSKYAGEVASALGIMKHNMLGRIDSLSRKADSPDA